MSLVQIVILGAVAGGTIFLGLPLGRLNAGPRLRGFLSAASVGILLFLFWDVTGGAFGAIEDAMHAAMDGSGAWTDFATLAVTGTLSLSVGLLGLVAYDRRVAARRRAGMGPGAASAAEFTAARAAAGGAELSMLIAVGIGLHNFAEGLAIGQSAATGEIAFALTLVIGFALHNATEGFGIVAPLAGGATRPSWPFLGLLGLIGGGPTALGTVVGQAWVNSTISVAFLGLAAGSILYVVLELANVNRALGLKVLVTSGILVGLLLGFGTDLILGALGV